MEEIEDEEVSDAFSEDGADPRDGSGKIRADQRDGFGKIRQDQRDGFSKIRAEHRDGFSKIREDRLDGFSKIRADQGDEFGFYSRRRTCKCQEETDETKCANRRNRFLALTAIESDDDEEVNAIETVQEVVEITVDSGAAKSVWPSRKKGVERTKSKKAVKLAATNGGPIRVEGDARLEFICCDRGRTRFEVGRDGKTAYERLKGKSAKVQDMAFAEGILWKRKRAGGPLGKLTCMWEDGIYLGIKATTAEIIV